MIFLKLSAYGKMLQVKNHSYYKNEEEISMDEEKNIVVFEPTVILDGEGNINTGDEHKYSVEQDNEFS